MATHEHENAAGEAYMTASNSSDDRINLEKLAPLTKADTIKTLPKEILEKLYLDTPSAVKGDLRKTFANPTPAGVACLIICAFPLSCDLMGWRGAGGLGAASGPAYIFMGTLLLIVSLLEFILGNTYIFVVLSTLAGFLLTLGTTFQPQFAAYAGYGGLNSPEFLASFTFWVAGFTVFFFLYTLCALRVNIMFFIVLLCLTMCGGFLTGSFWAAAAGNAEYAAKLQVGGGAMLFATVMNAFYVFVALLFLAVDFPIQLPLGDLSQRFPSYTEVQRRRANKMA